MLQKFALLLAFLALPAFAQKPELAGTEPIKSVQVKEDGSFALPNGVEGQLPSMPTDAARATLPKLIDGEIVSTTRAPAPPLSALEVYHVYSGTYSESIGDYQFTTVQDHDGPYLYVYTYEIGYGTSHNAWLDGYSISQSGSAALIDSYSNIVGWVREWNASTYANAQDFQFFNVNAVSINCCGSQSDNLTIK